MQWFLILLIIILFACEGNWQNQNYQTMQTEVDKVVKHFCQGQKIQLEISQKMAEYKNKGELPGDEINAQMDEANKFMDTYMNELQALLKKYQGQEQTIYNLLKKGQLNCKR